MGATRVTRLTIDDEEQEDSSFDYEINENDDEIIKEAIRDQEEKIKTIKNTYSRKIAVLKAKGKVAIKNQDKATLVKLKKQLDAVKAEGVKKLTTEKEILEELKHSDDDGLPDISQDKSEGIKSVQKESDKKTDTSATVHKITIPKKPRPIETNTLAPTLNSNTKKRLIILAVIIFFVLPLLLVIIGTAPWLIFVVVIVAIIIWIAKSEKAKKKIKDSIPFIKRHKKAFLCIVAGIVLLLVIVGIKNHIDTSIEEGRDYKITVNDNFTFDCDIETDESGDLWCSEKGIKGQFTNYSSVKLSRHYTSDINGDDFNYKIHHSLEDYYKAESYNSETLAKGIDFKETISLYNNYLKKEVATKTVAIHYNITEADLDAINKKHESWVKAKEEEAQRKAEEEAQRKAEEEARKKAEEEAQRKAEEARYPSEDGTRSLCDEAFHKMYPYKGSKVHSILRVRSIGRSGSNKMVYVVGVTVQNAYGAKYDADMECVVYREDNYIKVESLTLK